jgi:hypothetical protein
MIRSSKIISSFSRPYAPNISGIKLYSSEIYERPKNQYHKYHDFSFNNQNNEQLTKICSVCGLNAKFIMSCFLCRMWKKENDVSKQKKIEKK